MNLEEPKPEQDSNADLDLVKQLEDEILRSARGLDRFKREIPLLLRRAIDEVIDAPRTGRFTIDETEKTEKTYLGTKVEILLRYWLHFSKGKILDLSIDGVETDIKNTMRQNWMIPSEALDHPCILIKTDEKLAKFSLGIFIARSVHLSSGKNKDGKKSISMSGRKSIHWILKDQDYPENFWNSVSKDIRNKIASHRSGSKRVAELFRLVQSKPISRSHILGVAPQKDAMKRLRRNGGARDSLAPEGIVLLSGNYDRSVIEALKLPRCKKDEFISFTPTTEKDKSLLSIAGNLR